MGNDHDGAAFEAMPAVIVADERNKTGRNLAFLAFGILILFFVTSGYVQSSKNGRELDRAAEDRSHLVSVLDGQGQLIIQLQIALREQNQLLKDAGIKTVVIPGDKSVKIIIPRTTPSPSVRGKPRPNRPSAGGKPSPNSKPPPRPSHKPTPKPSPSPSPKTPPEEVIDTVCSLTGICL